MKLLKVFGVVLVVFSLMGCAGMSQTQQRVLSGSALGAAAGTGIAAVAGGSLAVGAAVGAAAGAVGGVIVDELHHKR
jgi:uncharacterized lipoprotein NlpE involved in copper resistance